jgi:hypothetical protein
MTGPTVEANAMLSSVRLSPEWQPAYLSPNAPHPTRTKHGSPTGSDGFERFEAAWRQKQWHEAPRSTAPAWPLSMLRFISSATAITSR